MTVNEYAYLCVFLYPHYMSQVYAEHKKLGLVPEESQGQIWATMEELVSDRGRKLCDKSFKALLEECLSNLYIHATSVNDLMRNAEEQMADESVVKAKIK